ncbi:cell division protein FtsA [Oceanirhabdus sp. W0125-5]|uniref:cell division protein FtsA n=1 Tax=Oceanirhabdus sp. W0125-5 TaxID=2999116 RepID=UPI0022F2DA85|nr:cell division protein FtsA [Oceanirhabdus sp. W0125-5]WBW96036.1 cell division protein FtsA [Oceanirhabdus sp. W0125-5]
MSVVNVNPKDVIFSLDIGTRTVIGTVGVMRDKKFSVICEEIIEHEDRAMVDGQIHDIELVKEGVQKVKEKLESTLGFKLTKVAVAAAGRLLKTTEVKSELEVEGDKEITKEIIKSLEMTAVKEAEEGITESSGGRLYCVGYSVKNFYLNGYLISNLLGHKGEKISCEVIATFLPRSVVESLYTVVNKLELEVMNMTLEPIAAMEAAVPKNLRLLNIGLVDIGAGTSDIAICSKDSVVAYGMVPMAGDEVTEVIAQSYLTDFNTAEKIKCGLLNQESVTYIDIMGFENSVTKDDVTKLISPLVEKISEGICSKIIELNGGKAPNAIFLVGGGAHTPGLKEEITAKLNLVPQRIAVKGREAVVECEGADDSLGSTGVTVLGIALMAVKNSGHDFINITLNGEVISLFNCYNHTVMDVLLQAGINPMNLIGKKGKNIKFVFNGRQRVAFGGMPKESVISVNNLIGSLDTVIKDGDEISLEYSVDGEDAAPKVSDYIKLVNTTSFYLNDEFKNYEPEILINEEAGNLDSLIKDGDEVQVIDECSIANIRRAFGINKDIEIQSEGKTLNEDYIVGEGERINTIDVFEAVACESSEDKEDNKEALKEETTLNTEKEENEITVIVNEEQYRMIGKEKYIFVDVFNYIKFDLSTPKGNLRMTLNGKNAGYYDQLSNGDEIKIFWE